MTAIRQQILIDAPTRTVWNAVTTAEGIAKWWASEARIDGREGGRVVLKHVAEDGASTEERGMVHKWRPTASFEVLIDGQGEVRGGTLAFLLGRGDGETKLHVTVSGGMVPDDEAARATIDAAWKGRLHRLRQVLEA